MKRLMCLLLLLWPIAAEAQNCPGGVCPRVIVPAVVKCEWRTDASVEPTQEFLYKGGVQVGAWSHKWNHYRPYNAKANVWGEVSEPPVKAPIARPIISQVEPNFGIDLDKMHPREKPTYRDKHGAEISRQEAFAALKDIPNDGGKLWLTVIGSEADRKKVTDDLPADLKEKLRVNSYPPDHWAVADGFITTGKPTVYLQAPDGTNIHRQDDYGGIADFEAIRKGVANYDAKKDPDLRKPAAAPGSSAVPLLILGGIAFLVLRKRPVNDP